MYHQYLLLSKCFPRLQSWGVSCLDSRLLSSCWHLVNWELWLKQSTLTLFSIVVLLFTSSFTQAAPANSDLSSELSSKLSSELSSRTEVAEWHSNYNTSDLAFPETGTCYPQPSQKYYLDIKPRLLLPVPALWRGRPDHHKRALLELHLPQSDAHVLPKVEQRHHYLFHCLHHYHRQGVPIHQACGSELCGGEERRSVLSNNILPPRLVTQRQ